MSQGDELRRVAGADAAVALGMALLRGQRRSARPPGEEREGYATIFRSIKRKDEVATLREVYGPRFLLIGGGLHGTTGLLKSTVACGPTTQVMMWVGMPSRQRR